MASTSRSLHQGRWKSVVELATRLCDSNILPCAAIATGSANGLEGIAHVGRQRPEGSQSLRDDAIFLVASITKPVVCMGAMLLIERGEFALVDRVADFIPEFGRKGKYGTEIRHLLSHTSGLPDMLPDNIELRKAHAPLSRYVERTCEESPIFTPGKGVQYQSMGIAVLGEIMALISGSRCPQFLNDEFFGPLGMSETALGAPDKWYEDEDRWIARIPEIVLIGEQSSGGTDWTLNSRYWRQLGVPWGGMLTTVSDLAKYAQFMLRGGMTVDGWRLISQATIETATRNQLDCMRDIPEFERRCRPWGLGWRLEWPSHSANFGDLLSPRTYGHWGATGTVLWIDPDAGIYGMVLTTMPQDNSGKYLSRISNAIAAAWE